MAAKVIEAGGRIFVNEDFVDDVLDLFPDTTTAVGTGWKINLGKTAMDLLLFTEHSPIPAMKDTPYVLTCPGGFEYAQAKIEAMRQWRSAHEDQVFKQAAKAPSGLYGYTKAVQSCCEGAVRKLNRRASRIVRTAVGRDEKVLDFLQKHAKRNNSKTAKVLLGAYKESMPKIAMFAARVAASAELGMYGIPAKTVKLGLGACSELHESAGSIVASLHSRRAELYKDVVGFFGQHAKEAGCMSSRLLSSCYPDC